MHIDFHDNTHAVPTENIDLLQQLLMYTAKEEKISEETELSISFVDNQKIKELNRNYRQQNKVTDVISFAMQELVEGEVGIIGETIPLVLGDIVISLDQAKVQANEYGHSLERELGFLIIHGLLHLLGYDHMNEEQEEVMFKKQNELLGGFGLER
ncbi:MAG TPA: rRNA maturation RNase YbeY [Virgibacillus sp.]|nr:rRNA maturation RNase YbeY [Virgibacillus sp.]